MTRTFALEDGVVPAAASILEIFGNIANYNVVEGCAVTYDGSDMTVDVAAGTITHNGTQVSVSVQANAVTLVADATNPRWSWVAVNSSGTAVLVSGTAAADPAVPDYGDTVPLALILIEADDTVANSITSKYDVRLFAPRDSATDSNGLDADVTTTSTTLADVSGLGATLSTSSTYVFEALIHYYAAAANDYEFAFTIPANAAIHAIVLYTNTSGTPTFGTLTSSGGSITANGFGATTAGVVRIYGSVITGATAGTLQFQHALGTGSGTNTTLEKSRLEVS